MTPHSELDRLIAMSDMAQEAKPRKQSQLEANALRKALKAEQENNGAEASVCIGMAANAHDKIQGAL